MRVLLDDRPLNAGTASIADALAAARADAEGRGRVIVEAVLDGEPLTDDQIAAPQAGSTRDSELRFVSADPAELVSSTLVGVAQSLDDAKADQAATAEHLTLGRMTEAIERLTQALRTWDAARQAVLNGTRLLGLSVETLRVRTDRGEVPLSDQVRSLTGRLAEVKRAVEAQDWSALADVMAYDLADQADRWREALLGLAEQIRQRPAAQPGPMR